ncbi:uncharacterized protein BDW43DRAFT_301866 [Aspergillus alliaceus]|uniref:uncharacterized protein n=1 Tax=Petromyces alliaceus TaxID=209559 RepID=UPI0012A67797|nr:uncharacterized protein BDW43DRAFT_301866 [Aspergillus alliaceus]KAB8231180.1 hypothetical protein BDW43DRAFT_301866 [Aspergillus alliaceus]
MDSLSSDLVRRNGSKRSCEACRKSKTKCDHTLPICGRCARKSILCFYDPAPMTRKFRPMSIIKSRTQRKTRNSGSPGASWAVVVSTPPLESAGFLGPTSYRSLMTGAVNDGDPGPSDNDRTIYTIDPKQLDLGLRILDFLAANALLLRALVRQVYELGLMPIIPEVLMLPALDILWDVFGNYIVQDESLRLRTVVDIFENSYQPIPITLAMNAGELCSLISGKNVRWEMIGSVITVATVRLIHTPERDVIHIDPQQRRKDKLLTQMLEITDQLLPLSNALPVVNELMVCLKYSQMMLASQRFGDSRIHQYNDHMAQYPGFMNLWRRRCFASVYSTDKTIATTLGRPPSLTRHYCVLKPPLDIDDDIDAPTYEQSLRMIDNNGWNSDGKRRHSTFIRLRFLLSTIREEILELHLGVSSADMERKAHDVLQKLQSLWDSCPSYMKYSPDMWNSQLPALEILVLLYLFVDYLYSMFLLYRLKSQESQKGKPKELLHVAKTILSTVVVINEHRERAREVRSDFSSIFLPFGLPSAELLAMELLQPSLQGPPHSSLPRAEIIRELTLYTSCLSWIARPGSVNVAFCNKVKARLTRILDQILDPSYAAPGSSNSQSGAGREANWACLELADSDFTIHNLLCSDDGSNWDSGFDLFCGPVF